METIARKQLLAYAKAHVDACERDYEAAQNRLDTARRILAHVQDGSPAASCPCPSSPETAATVERFAARVDALLMTCYSEETEGK